MKRSALKSLLIVLAGAGLVLAAGCDGKEPPPPDVLVTVNNDYITKSDLQRAWALLPDSEKENYAGPGGAKTLLDELITYEMMSQEALDKNLDKDPEVKRQLDFARKKILVNALIEKRVTKADLFNYYQQHFLRVRFIRAGFNDETSDATREEARKKIQEIYSSFDEKTDFGAVAREKSDAANSSAGGDMGYVTLDTITNMAGAKASEHVGRLANPGDVTPPIETDKGFFIFQLVEPSGDLHPGGLTPELENAIAAIKRNEVVRSYANELNTRQDRDIKFDDENVKQLMEQIRREMEAYETDTNSPGAADGSTAEQPGAAPGTGEGDTAR